MQEKKNNLQKGNLIEIPVIPYRVKWKSNFKLEEAKNEAQNTLKESILRSNKEYNNQIDTIKKQIANMQIKAESNITEYKKSLEKDIERSAISLSAVILSKLNYKNSTTEQIKEKLSKFSMSNNV